MISKRWRKRLAYTAMSAFVGWHTLAIMVAPAPDSSVIVQSIRPLLHPYLALFYLDSNWDFFAPDVERGKQFRYIVEGPGGTSHTFVPIEEVNWFHPIYRRYGYWYDAIVDTPETHVDFVAASLCRKHASLRPVSITLIGVQIENFSREDHLTGKHPLDAELATVTTLKHVPCPGS